MKPKSHQNRGFTLVELLVVVTIIATLAGLSITQVGRAIAAGHRTTAISNAKQLHLALTDFAEEYGSLPDRDTAAAVKERTRTNCNLTGDTANDYFRQLIAAGIVKSEAPFHAPTTRSKKKPDNIFDGSNALEPGEVGFSYLMNGTSGMPLDIPNRIIAIAPLANASKEEFDTAIYADKAVALCADGATEVISLQPATRKALMPKGKTLLETGPGTRWGDDVRPVIKSPKFK